MSQDLFDGQDVTKVECPVCGVASWEGAPTCLSCGTTLRATAVAVPADLWTSDDDSLFDEVAEAELVDDGDTLWDDASPTPGDAAGPFGTGAAGSPLFAAPSPTPAAGAPSGPDADALWDQVDDAAGEPPSSVPVDGADPHGLGAAVGRLDPSAVERAVVPLAVCSVLLEDDEVVAAALIGEMLGQPAAMVLTGRRVLVANGRRWRPVVDSFPLGAGLGVRGRHDGGVAALTLLDDERLVTVDGVGDVAAATRFADLVRARSGA